jgi:hypothetical protein
VLVHSATVAPTEMFQPATNLAAKRALPYGAGASSKNDDASLEQHRSVSLCLCPDPARLARMTSQTYLQRQRRRNHLCASVNVLRCVTFTIARPAQLSTSRVRVWWHGLSPVPTNIAARVQGRQIGSERNRLFQLTHERFSMRSISLQRFLATGPPNL